MKPHDDIDDEDPILGEQTCRGVQVLKRSTDSMALRISVGAVRIGDSHPGVYCVFRGDRAACVVALRRALLALEESVL